MAYLPPFEKLKTLLSLATIRGKLVASAPFEDMQALIRALLVAVPVDEAWYLSRYPDIADAVEKGVVSSAREHFVQNGYFEGRLPFAMPVDEAFYFQQYPEVAEAVEGGMMDSAQTHFDRHGYSEGRLPHPV